MEILPNCLTKEPKIDWNLSKGGTRWFYLFCASCGADGGRVMETDLPQQYAFYLCQKCADIYGQLTGHAMIPDEVFWKQIADEQIQKYGRILNEQELEAAANSDTSLAKLARDRAEFHKLARG